ncbi:hypothetical protein [Rugamonas sp.]|uniref:hypothetical protein n=1 Tax=Rugamonas sp. TaxID=1926287 RepID=UPI0025CEDE2F|nr:hypothetical protein [Rugamonas sp.]
MFTISSLLRSALLATLMLGCAAVQAQDKIILASIVDQDSYAGRLLQLIYSDAFAQLHLDVELRYYPAARASAESKAGNVDGETSRSYEYGALHPELLRIEALVLSVTTSAFAHDPRIRVHGLESLRGSGYRIEYRAGYARAARQLVGVVPPALLSSVVDSRFGLKKLAIGRTDLYIDVEETVLPLLDVEPFKSAGIYKAGVIDSFPVYCYLGRRHAGLAPRMAEILKKMKASGTLERYRMMARAASTPR